MKGRVLILRIIIGFAVTLLLAAQRDKEVLPPAMKKPVEGEKTHLFKN
jgi:hypothetical protein